MKKTSLSKSLCWIAVLSLGCSFFTNCKSTTSKHQSTNKPQTSSKFDETLTLTKDQIEFIQNHVSQLLAWEGYWTVDKPDKDVAYEITIGKKIPIALLSLDGYVIVHLQLFERYYEIKYDKYGDGYLSSPEISRPVNPLPTSQSTEHHRDGLEAFFENASRSNLEPFVKETLKNLTGQRSSYWIGSGEIELLPIAPMKFSPMTPEKRMMLDRISKESYRQASKMLDKNERLKITIPNFNLGDSGIWVLIEHGKREGFVMALSLPMSLQREPVAVSGFVNFDINNPRYGIKTYEVEKIKANAIKVIRSVMR